jgi:hypothetical protein
VKFRLIDLDQTGKLLVTSFLVVLTLGYGLGLFFVEHRTSMTASGVEHQFLGTPEYEAAAEIQYAKSPTEMLVFLHNHVFSLSLVFFAVGTLFYFSALPSPFWKRFLLIEPFAAIITTFGGIALIRYVSPLFSWLVIVSGVSIACCYVAMTVIILKDLWWPARGT